jgi:SAM-dependent methyltransferase
MQILNIGCGTKTSDDPSVVNLDWSLYLRIKQSPIARRVASSLLTGERKARLLALGDNIRVHDMRKGLPFPNGTVDVVYHSHFLEHLDRSDVPAFLSEVRRVLRSGGVHRIVVPDFEVACRRYLEHVNRCERDLEARDAHEDYIAELLEQSVRREAFGTSQQTPVRRWLENRILGDARKRGETHQWMYDRISLSQLLLSAGFCAPRQLSHAESQVRAWSALGLDQDATGSEYKPNSLYMECMNP